MTKLWTAKNGHHCQDCAGLGDPASPSLLFSTAESRRQELQARPGIWNFSRVRRNCSLTYSKINQSLHSIDWQVLVFPALIHGLKTTSLIFLLGNWLTKGRFHEEKLLFFWILSKLHPPNLDNFFWRQNSRFENQFRTKDTIYTI